VTFKELLQTGSDPDAYKTTFFGAAHKRLKLNNQMQLISGQE
jgi:hypothetical protein